MIYNLKGRIYHYNIFLAQKRLKSPLSGWWEGGGGQFLYCQTGEQGGDRQMGTLTFTMRGESREKGPGHTTLSLLTAILGLVVAKQL